MCVIYSMALRLFAKIQLQNKRFLLKSQQLSPQKATTVKSAWCHTKTRLVMHIIPNSQLTHTLMYVSTRIIHVLILQCMWVYVLSYHDILISTLQLCILLIKSSFIATLISLPLLEQPFVCISLHQHRTMVKSLVTCPLWLDNCHIWFTSVLSTQGMGRTAGQQCCRGRLSEFRVLPSVLGTQGMGRTMG